MLLLYPIAFISGILTVFSPCVLPILPIVLGSGLDGKKARIRGTIVGLVLSFTFFALALSRIINLFGVDAETLRIVAASILGVFGLFLVLPGLWEPIQVKLEQMFRPPQAGVDGSRSGFGGGLITGGVLGFVWTPCVGPIIATITTLAALESFSFSLLGLMFIYALGIGLPLLLIAEGGTRVSEKLGWYKNHQVGVRKIFGLVIVLTALIIGTGAERNFQSWVLDNIPSNISNPVANFERRFDVVDKMREDLGGQMDNLGKELEMRRNSNEEVINRVNLKIEKDGAKIDLKDLLQGCPIKDCIPSIDDPVFESMAQAGSWLEDDDRVFILTFDGQTKIYPQRIMNWHEIVNDWYPNESASAANRTAIAVTFCPLCGTATAFERRANGVITEFGVSGKLHNSDLVMYDRYEGSLWQQVSGEAISGPAARRDEVVEPLFLITLDWSQAKEKFVDALVLSRDTGHNRDYGRYPYGTYEEDGDIYFRVGNEDNRLHPKAWVYGIIVNGQAMAYPEEKLLESSGTIKDIVGNVAIEVTNDDGVISFRNVQTDEEIVPLRGFWFAWAAFNPETELY